MAKLTLVDMTVDRLESITNYNTNNASIVAALENTLSRDGTSPNTMEADFDMNGYELLNAAIRLRPFTATQIADLSHAVNSTSKAQGTVVYDTTNKRVMVADGASAGDVWTSADGATTVTPS